MPTKKKGGGGVGGKKKTMHTFFFNISSWKLHIYKTRAVLHEACATDLSTLAGGTLSGALAELVDGCCNGSQVAERGSQARWAPFGDWNATNGVREHQGASRVVQWAFAVGVEARFRAVEPPPFLKIYLKIQLKRI